MFLRVGGILFCSFVLVGQSTKPSKITVEEQLEWALARAEIAEAQVAALKADKRMQAILTIMQAKCKLVLNSQGLPDCAPPLPPSKESK